MYYYNFNVVKRQSLILSRDETDLNSLSALDLHNYSSIQMSSDCSIFYVRGMLYNSTLHYGTVLIATQ